MIKKPIEETPNHSFPDIVDLGKILQIGCGAVGSSLDYLLALSPITGVFQLVDYDRVEISNLNRSLLFTSVDAIKNNQKVSACQRMLSSVAKTNVCDSSFRDYSKKRLKLDQPDMILCLANEQNVWNTIQNHYPPLVFHAATTRNWGINIGRHIKLNEWCIMCRFKDTILIDDSMECGVGSISTQVDKDRKDIQGVLPFLSPLCSVFLLSEMIKVATNEKNPNNFIQFSMKERCQDIIGLHQKKRVNCICDSQYRDIFNRMNNGTKYWNLS